MLHYVTLRYSMLHYAKLRNVMFLFYSVIVGVSDLECYACVGIEGFNCDPRHGNVTTVTCDGSCFVSSQLYMLFV